MLRQTSIWTGGANVVCATRQREALPGRGHWDCMNDVDLSDKVPQGHKVPQNPMIYDDLKGLFWILRILRYLMDI